MSLKQSPMRSYQKKRPRKKTPKPSSFLDEASAPSETDDSLAPESLTNVTAAKVGGWAEDTEPSEEKLLVHSEKTTDTKAFSGTLLQDVEVLPMREPTPLAEVCLPFESSVDSLASTNVSSEASAPNLYVVPQQEASSVDAAPAELPAEHQDLPADQELDAPDAQQSSELAKVPQLEVSDPMVPDDLTQEESPMSDLSGYKDLSKAPFLGEDDDNDSAVDTPRAVATMEPPAPPLASLSSFGSAKVPQLSLDNLGDAKPAIETEISGNVQTLIRLVSELPEGVTKQNGAQIIRLTMEAMGIPMEDVLAEAQASQTELLDAVRGNLKKIEEYKAVIRKLETDIKYYQGKANELSEIIDLFIMSGGAAGDFGGQTV